MEGIRSETSAVEADEVKYWLHKASNHRGKTVARIMHVHSFSYDKMSDGGFNSIDDINFLLRSCAVKGYSVIKLFRD